jgi:ribonuclease PH
MLHEVAAVSVGVVKGVVLADLCYEEDVGASVDMNLVMNAKGEFIELQGTGEESTFSEEELRQMLLAGKAAIRELIDRQREALA